MSYYLTQNEHKVVWVYSEPPENEDYIEVEELPEGEGPILINDDGTLGRKGLQPTPSVEIPSESPFVSALVD